MAYARIAQGGANFLTFITCRRLNKLEEVRQNALRDTQNLENAGEVLRAAVPTMQQSSLAIAATALKVDVALNLIANLRGNMRGRLQQQQQQQML